MNVNKTIKMYIGGEFPRTESGRSRPLFYYQSQKEYARYCLASRKDFRNSVEAAEKGFASWSKRTAYNRGQILYRMAEMMQGKKQEFATLFSNILGYQIDQAEKEVQQGIDQLVHYAGWSDKFSQVLCSVNSINGTFHNFTTPVARGVSVLIDSDNLHFGQFCSALGALLSSGNSVIVLLGSSCPALIAPFSEVLATSDLPAGAVNLLSGDVEELISFIGGHYEVQSIFYSSTSEQYAKDIKTLAAENLKRVFCYDKNSWDSLQLIGQSVEMQTVWHPIGL